MTSAGTSWTATTEVGPKLEEQCDWGKRDAAEVHEHSDAESGIVYRVG